MNFLRLTKIWIICKGLVSGLNKILSILALKATPSLLFGLLFFVGCTSSQMSLEQAMSVSLTTSKKNMEPPPRRVDDILGMLNKYKGERSEIVENYVNLLGLSPPANTNSNEMAHFYHKRAMASIRVGDDRNALENIRIAYDMDQQDGKVSIEILRDRAIIEQWGGGNVKFAIELYKKVIDRPDAVFSSRVHLTEAYLIYGDIANAESSADNAKQVYRRSNYDKWLELHMSYIDGLMLDVKGNYSSASEKWIKARRLIDTEKNKYPGLYFWIQRHLINNLIAQNKLVSAELEVRNFLKDYLTLVGKNPDSTSRILLVYGEILYEQGRCKEAERVIKSGISMREDLKSNGVQKFESDIIFVDFLKTLMEISCSNDRFLEAYSYFEDSKKYFDKDGFSYAKNYSKNHNLLIAMIFSNHINEAAGHVDKLFQYYNEVVGADDINAVELRMVRGIVHFQNGKLSEAYRDYQSSIQKFLEFRSEYWKSFSKKQRFRKILEAYLSLFSSIHNTKHETEIGINASLEAFKLVEVLRHGTVQQALAASASRLATQNAELSSLVRQEQDNGLMITVLDRMLINHISMPTDQQDPKVISGLKTQIATLSAARSTLLAEIKQKFPDYENLVNPKPAHYQTVARFIRPHETLISIFPSAEHSYLWTINDKVKVEFAVLPVGAKQIAAGVNDIRRSLDLSCDKLGEIPEFNLKLSHWFYMTFLEPVKSSWSGKKDLLIVADGPLGSLPFSVLTTQPHALSKPPDLLFSGYRHAPWLVRQVSLTRLPSVSALIGLRSLPPGDPDRKAFVGFGDPIFNPEQMQTAKQNELSTKMAQRGAQFQIRGVRITQQGSIDQTNLVSNRLSMLNRLQDTAEEVISVGQSLQADAQQDLFLGLKATEHTVRSLDLSNRRVVYFATHALVPGDIDGLHEPALALSSPEVAGGDEDGLLTAGEIMTLKLNADWVILSACNTAAAAGEGAEAISGLGRAFFYAGTRALLVSLWPVETSSALELTTRLFEAQSVDAGLSRSAALRSSMLQLIDGPGMVDTASGRTVASYAHPFFWAPFILVGDN
jgi:CHAT domain-containing protein/tetratricopeptide (TPR) repeat protein